MANNIDRADHGTHSIVNYSLFVGLWWLLSLIYFIPTSFIDKFSIPIVDVAMDALSVLFSFCAAVALAAYLGAHSCSNRVRETTFISFQESRLTNPQAYTTSNGVCNSSANTEQNCRQAQATCAFLWFGFAAFAATLAINVMNGSGSGVNMRGGIRRGGPSMSQV